MISTSPVPKFRYLLHQSHQSHRSYLEYFGHHFVHLPTVSSHPLLHPHHHHQNQKQKHYFFTFPSLETFLINFYKTEIDVISNICTIYASWESQPNILNRAIVMLIHKMTLKNAIIHIKIMRLIQQYFSDFIVVTIFDESKIFPFLFILFM